MPIFFRKPSLGVLVRRHRRQLLLGAVFILILSIAYVVYFRQGRLYRNAAFVTHQMERFRDFVALQPTDRLTIISPHVDDETLGLGGLIALARQENLPVSVIFMTNGDDFPLSADYEFKTGYPTPEELLELGDLRHKEGIKALAKLGVEEKDIYFLGLPDRGLDKLRLPKYQEKAYVAPGTLENHSPYSFSLVKDLTYTGQATRQALRQAIEKTNPTYVFTTAVDDRHTDHKATALFTQEVIQEMKSQVQLYYYLVHYANYPLPRGNNTGLPLLPPPKLAQADWNVIYLERSLVEKKQEAVNEYESQLRLPQIGKLMRSLVRNNELVFTSK